MRKLNKYLIAVFLLLNFAQGISMRLWMHHWFHESGMSKAAGVHSSNEVKIKCDCLQDASMPLQDVPCFELIIPYQLYFSGYARLIISFSSFEKIFCSLKGPPPACFPDIIS